jgi:hypothetical protein
VSDLNIDTILNRKFGNFQGTREAHKSGKEPELDEFTRKRLEEQKKREEEAERKLMAELQNAERERKARDPRNAFTKNRPAVHQSLEDMEKEGKITRKKYIISIRILEK